MNFIELASLWIGGWILIIIIHGAYSQKSKSENKEFVKKEMVKDGNNLFATGLLYFLITVACHFIRYKVFWWIGFIFCSVFVVISIVGTIRLVAAKREPISQKITAIINVAVPAIMAINLYYTYLM